MVRIERRRRKVADVCVCFSKRTHLGYITHMPHHTTPPQHCATPALEAAPTSCHTQHVHSPRTPSTTHMTPEITDSSSTKPANHAQHPTWTLLSSRCKIKKDARHICCCSCANQRKSSTSIPHTTVCRPNPFRKHYVLYIVQKVMITIYGVVDVALSGCHIMKDKQKSKK